MQSWEDELRKTSMAYGGAEECLTALPLRAHELEPGLAPADVSGSITPEMWLDSDMCSFLRDPLSNLLPENEWPSKIPFADVNVENESEWQSVVELLYARKVISAIHAHDIFRVRRQLLLNGSFAVSKSLSLDGTLITRLIFNLVPSNSIQKSKTKHTRSMTNAACWIRTVLLPRQCILWSSNDLSCAFYLLRVPSIWRQFVTLRRRVRTEWVGLPPGGYTYVTCDVVPMGWLSAVEIFQEFHRALVLKKHPLGAGLPRSLEWSRIDGGPNIQLLRKWFQIYVDDFDLAELIEIELVEELLRTKSDL